MRAWRLADASVYRRLALRAHVLLADVPLHDVWQLDLPGSGEPAEPAQPAAIAEVLALMSVESLANINPVVSGLFRFRSFLGRVFDWDSPRRTAGAESFLSRLCEEDREQSLVEPGSADGPFTVLYVHPAEAVSEIRNATVHAFSVLALESISTGHRLYWAIYVAPVGRFTALYMAAIDPFRRWLVYPAVLRHVHRAWTKRQATA